jgi:hypothetical protein
MDTLLVREGSRVRDVHAADDAAPPPGGNLATEHVDRPSVRTSLL